VRRFNTEGPVFPNRHYCIPPLARLDDVDRVLELVRDMRYFVLHAPRQTGKTSALLALRDLLNTGAGGDLHCVYVNIEPAQAQRKNVERAMRVIVGQVASRARASGDGFLYQVWTDIFAAFGGGALQEALSRWAEESPKPLVVLIDHRARPGADRAVHGPLRLAGGAPGDLRPRCRQELGREGVPAGREPRRALDRGVGDVAVLARGGALRMDATVAGAALHRGRWVTIGRGDTRYGGRVTRATRFSWETAHDR